MTLKLSVQDPSPIATGDTPVEALKKTIELARLVDELGYARFWMNEHHGVLSLASIAPEIILARVGAETSKIRLGTGGLILPNYPSLKIAEIFRTLQTLFPDRIDLGIARPAGSPIPAAALRRERRVEPIDDFADQLQELLMFLGKTTFPVGHAFSKVNVVPNTAGDAPVWVLGSSLRSASIAAKAGLPYAYSHFHNPALTRQAIQCYREEFVPSHPAGQPQCMVFLGVLCAENQIEADRLHTTMQLFLKRARVGDMRLFENPLEASRELTDSQQNSSSHRGVASDWPHFLVGTPDQVHEKLILISQALQVDEFIVQTICWDHDARLRSYRLLASELGLRHSLSHPASPMHSNASDRHFTSLQQMGN